MKKRKKLVIILVIVVVVALLGAKTLLSPKNNIRTVDTAEASSKTLVQSITLTGNIKTKDAEEILLPTTQKVTKVLVEEGQEVEKNQPLIKLDTYDLESQLQKAQISLEMAERELANLIKENSSSRKSLENAVAQAELNLKNAQSKYEDAKTRHEQSKKLYEAGFISKSEYDNSLSALMDMESNVQSAEIALDNAKRALEDYDERIYQQQKQLELTRLDLSNLKKKIADSNIKASIKGKVVKLDVIEGQYPSMESSIRIQDTSNLILELKANQYDAVNLKLGQKAKITVNGLDKEYEGHITKISETAAVEVVNTGKEINVLTEITIDNADEILKAGYEADAEIILSEKTDTIAVNYEAVQTDENGNKYIFVVEDNIAKKRIVETGLETDFEIEILSGLKKGEIYITNPPADLMDGETVVTTGGM